MKILMISTNRNALPVPVFPYGACLVADAVSRSGHEVRFIDLMFEKDPRRTVESALDRFAPDVVGISVRNIDNNDMQSPVCFAADGIELVRAIRKRSAAPVVLGGAAMGVMPEQLLRATGADFCIPADGDVVFPIFLRAVAEGRDLRGVAGVAFLENGSYTRNPPHTGADHCASGEIFRWVDRARYASHLSPAPLQTKTGCGFSCIYCTYRKIEGSEVRLTDRNSVLDAVHTYARAGIRDIEFVDNVFNYPPAHAHALCEDLARLAAPMQYSSMELNPGFLDRPLLDIMQRAGFNGIGITAESASDTALRNLRKPYSSDAVARAADLVSRQRLPCFWIFLFGGPGETESTVNETLRFAEEQIRSADTAFFNAGIRIYPGTEIETIARTEGVLRSEREEMLEPVFYFSPELDPAWLRARLKDVTSRRMNFMGPDSLSLPYLPRLHRIASRLGMRPPLWRHTRAIRRGLKMIGIDA